MNNGVRKKVTLAGLLVSIGIVYGDIGTSPLYVMKAIVNENGGIASVNREYIGLVNDEVEWGSGFRHALVVVLHVYFLCLQESSLNAWLREVLDEGRVLWKALVGTEEGEEACCHLIFILRLYESLSLCEVVLSLASLCLYELFDDGAVLLKHLDISLSYRA